MRGNGELHEELAVEKGEACSGTHNSGSEWNAKCTASRRQ